MSRRSLAPDVWKVGRQTLTGFVRHREGWLYIAPDTGGPGDSARSANRAWRSAIAVRFGRDVLSGAPAGGLRTLAIDHVREERQLRLDVQPGNQAAHSVASPALASLGYDTVDEFFTDVRQLTLGWSLDRQRKTAAWMS